MTVKYSMRKTSCLLSQTYMRSKYTSSLRRTGECVKVSQTSKICANVSKVSDRIEAR